jgi:FtsH-binding integral membrane protein
MVSAALSDSEPQSAPDTYMRSVWARLAAGAFTAGLSAWVVAMLPPLRGVILIERGPAAIGLTLIGVALAVSPFLIWASARFLARGPNLLNPLWYWLFAISAGAGVNTLTLLFLRDSVASVFALAAFGFAAVYLVHRLMRQLPPWGSALTFVAAGLGGEYAISGVLTRSWAVTAIGLGAVGVFAVMILLRAGAFARIRALLKRPHPKAGVTYAAMHLIALAEAPADKISAVVEEEVRS